jgi:hypothetical protein
VSETVRLKDGVARRGDDSGIGPLQGGGSWKIAGSPQYSYADGDGDEDAAVGLHTSGGQSANTNWYIWMWQGAAAVQVRPPIVSATRCDRPIESVRAVVGGFALSDLVALASAMY